MCCRGWKVLRIEGEEDCGFSASIFLADAIATYHRGKWTVPRHGCGPLQVCTTYEAARLLVTSWDTEELKLIAVPCWYRKSSFKYSLPKSQLTRDVDNADAVMCSW